jgi:UDP-N-acetylglucosamine/UDP-N-acetylgalactosamine 4-epimerase
VTEVVVTGISSFVGHHLARRFALRGDHVIGTISRPRDRYQGIEAQRIAAIEPYVEIFGLDLREPREFAALVDRRAPSLWIHHAGFAADYASSAYDLEIAHVINVAPLSALYAALRGGSCGVIITGSSAEYAASTAANHEADACFPDAPYGLSKLTQTLRARQLAEQLDVPTRVARLYIPFGERDSPAKLLPQVVAKLRCREPIALSPCEQQRDFVGIADVCSAYERLAEHLTERGFDIFNVAGGSPVTLRAFLCEIADLMKANRELLRFGTREMRPGEPPISYADVGKARRILGWQPTPLTEAIQRDLFAGKVSP